MYNNYFSNFGRPLVLNDLCKDSASRHPWFWKRKLLKVFTIYGHGDHLGQWTMTILAIFHSPNLRRLHMNMTSFSLRKKSGKKIHAQLIIQQMFYGYCPQLSYTNESVHNRWYYQIYLGNYFSLITLVLCTAKYSLKIFIF